MKVKELIEFAKIMDMDDVFNDYEIMFVDKNNKIKQLSGFGVNHDTKHIFLNEG